MRTFVSALAAAVLAALASTASAQAYIGGVVGASDMDIDCRGASRCDQGDVALKLYFGLPIANRVIPTLALEAGYIDFGEGQAANAVASRKVSVSALTFAAAARVKFSPVLSGVGRLGLAYVDAKATGNVGPFLVNGGSDTQLTPYLGFGLEYALNRQLGHRRGRFHQLRHRQRERLRPPDRRGPAVPVLIADTGRTMKKGTPRGALVVPALRPAMRQRIRPKPSSSDARRAAAARCSRSAVPCP